MVDKILDELKSILPSENVSIDPQILEEYKSDVSLGLSEPKLPKYIVWPENMKQVQQLVQVANKHSLALVPTSSEPPRFHGTSIPKKDNAIVVDFTRMKKILNVDPKNRVMMIESGVNFEEYIAKTREAKLRPHLPLYPYAKKSVVGAALDREPVLIPKYHWDIADPLLCTELVFGTGNMFRTGAAAGPGSLTQQKESGGAQKNPMGPTQFSPFRVVQGAQGTIALVTWATLKVQRKIDLRKTFYVTSDTLGPNFPFIYELLKYRLGDEMFILNDLNLAILLEEKSANIGQLRKELPKWITVISITGTGPLAQERLDWQEGDITEYAEKFDVELRTSIPKVSNDSVQKIMEEAAPSPWRLSYKGGCHDLFFISTLDKTPKYQELMWQSAKQNKFDCSNIGVYIQPMVQGCNVHCEFDLYYNPDNENECEISKNYFVKSSEDLIKNGAFFNRPYGIWADMIYSKIQPLIVESMRKVKKVFDPKNVLNPGALCFKEEVS